MTYDFRANQVRLNKIISSGSIPILIYPSSSASDFDGNVNFSTSGIGSDVFLFVSGNLDGTSKALFGGNVVTSGSIRSLNGITGSVQYTDDATTPFIVNGPNITTNYNSLGQWEITGSGGGGGTNYFTEIALNSIETTGSVAMTYLSASTGAEITGSLAQGLGINVTGFYSHAEGTSTVASGFYAHAEGSSTNAAGLGSHAEGSSTNANGWYSHAEGTFSVTNGDFSHAEGSGATTYGSSSHAEGFAAASYGDFSHAEGAFSATNGLYSHAEGYFTLAHGEASHAEGFGSETVGTGSFAAGLYTVASSSIDGTFPPTTIQAAFGKYNLQGNSDSLFVVGDGFDASNRHDVFRVNSGSVQVTGSLEVLGGITGSLSGTVAGNPFIIAGSNITTNYNSLGQWEITGSAVNYFTEIALDSIATTGSVAMTYLSASTGAGITGSFILSSSIPARIITSVRLGDATVTANGLYAFAHAFAGAAAGDYSYVQGYSGAANGNYSHAEGNSSLASGVSSHAEGNATTASGIYSHSEGYQTAASGNSAHSEGSSTTASGDASHTEGYNTTASGTNCHAEGYSTSAGSISAGNAHSEGAYTIASGDSSHAEGSTTTASGAASHAEGYITKSRGNYSHAQGWGSEAYGAGSLAAGLYTVASGSGPTDNPPTTTQASFGKYNLQGNSDSLFVIGDGLDGSNRHDVFRVNSGSVQITGSLEVLGGITGSISGTVAGNPFIVAGTNVTVNYNSLGQWEVTSSGGGGGGGGTQKQFVAKYEETTSTTPIIIGQFSWIPSDYASLTTLRVRAIMSTDGTANHTGSLQIYNLTSNAYVNLVDTPSVDSLFTITSSTPTLVTSSNLLSGGTNFDNITDSIYEVRISGSTANTTIIGGVELVYS